MAHCLNWKLAHCSNITLLDPFKVLIVPIERINFQLFQQNLDVATEPWGVKVERVEVKDVRVPEQLQRAMAAEAEAAREARAKVINAEGERDASESLKEAAKVIQRSPQALQVTKFLILTFIILII